MQAVRGMPPMRAADDRRIAGWRILREYLASKGEHPSIKICDGCQNLITSLPALLCDTKRAEDASGSPHKITHSPEALRYAVMSRAHLPNETYAKSTSFFKDFKMPKEPSIFD